MPWTVSTRKTLGTTQSVGSFVIFFKEKKQPSGLIFTCSFMFEPLNMKELLLKSNELNYNFTSDLDDIHI